MVQGVYYRLGIGEQREAIQKLLAWEVTIVVVCPLLLVVAVPVC
jgi:hypothetical protein